MRKLILFLFLASPIFAREHDFSGAFAHPNLPVARVIAVPEPQTHTFCASDSNCAYTGNNTHSGTETFTNRLSAGNISDILVVDGVQYANISAAVAAAGSNTRIIQIPSTYLGTECPASVITTLIFQDFRPTFSGGPCTQNVSSWNQASGSGQHSMNRVIWQKVSPASSDVALFYQGQYSGTMPASNSLEGMAGEADSIGTMISIPGSANLIGIEGDAVLSSLGQTWSSIYAGFFKVVSQVGNTTNCTQCAAIRAAAQGKSGSETVTQAIGLLADAQTVGSVTNLSIWSLGATQTDGPAKFDCTVADCVNIPGDQFSNSSGLRLTDTHAGGGDWRVGEQNAVMELDFRNLNVSGGPYWGITLGGTGTFGGVFTHSNTATRTYTFPNFSPVSMSGIIASGTSTLTSNAALATVTSQAAITTAATNTLTTDAIEWSYATAPTAGDSLCIVSAYVTAGNVNFVRANPTAAAQNVSALVINWRVIR